MLHEVLAFQVDRQSVVPLIPDTTRPSHAVRREKPWPGQREEGGKPPDPVGAMFNILHDDPAQNSPAGPLASMSPVNESADTRRNDVRAPRCCKYVGQVR